jgi:hypothetical protein
VVAPLLAPGFVLSYDLSFVPRPRLSAGLIGLGTALPTNVPFGLLVAVAARVLTGQIVEKALLAAVFIGAAWGAARLVPADRPAGRIAAGVLFAWNPLTYERLLLGQVAFLLAYACLPWLVRAALRVRAGGPGAMAALVLWLAAAAATGPYGGLFGASAALSVLAFPDRTSALPRRRALLAALAAAVVVNLPWLLPSVLRPGGASSPAVAFDLFRARSDSPLGLLGSVLSLGGLWRTDLAPPGRDTVAWVPAFLLILALALFGAWVLRQRWPRGAAAGLVWLSAAGLLLAVGVSLPGLGGAVLWIGRHAPGGGILRDGQKFVAPFALLLAVAFGLGVDRLTGRVERLPWRRVVAAALVALGAALAPTLAWGAGGRLFTSEYPVAWDRARAAIAADPRPGAMLVLPWHLHLPLSWNRGRVVANPALAYFTRQAVVSDALEVGTVRLPPADNWAALADPVVRGGRPLAPELPRLGIRFVLLLHQSDWRSARPLVAGLATVIRTQELELFASGLPAPPPGLPKPPSAVVILGDVAAAALVVWALAARARAGSLRGNPAGILSREGRRRPRES